MYTYSGKPPNGRDEGDEGDEGDKSDKGDGPMSAINLDSDLADVDESKHWDVIRMMLE